jgi:hypothetical protein
VAAQTRAEEKPATPAPTPTEAAPAERRLASFAERLATAKSVKVQTDILGIEIDSSLESAREKLEPLTDRAGRPKEEEDKADEEGERKLLWKLNRSDYESIFLKADAKERVTYLLATLRPGKQIPFEQIGEVAKAPVHNNNVVAWDVVREHRPLIRVVARGSGGKADSITIFLVRRSPE